MKKTKIKLKLLAVAFSMAMLTLFANSANAQSIQVQGTVTDGFGPLVGASVLNKGTVSITNDLGVYEIKANIGDTLSFIYIGYKTEKRIVSGEVINVQMVTDNSLDGVTVVAFGTQKSESVVASITTIRPADLQVPSSNLTTSLGGRIAGLISMQTSGEPGADNADFFVRGVTTFNEYSRGPLILIDNMELSTSDLARLSVDDIESFSIMKDATATALYGSRGANGVILVTTKEGVEGQTKLNFRLENSFSQPTQEVEFADPVTYMRLYNESIVTRNPLYSTRYTDEQIMGVEQNINPYYYPSNDWNNLLFKNLAQNQRANLSLSGGGKKVRFYIAGSFTNDNGVLNTPGTSNFNNNIKIQNIGIRSNTNIELTPTTTAAIRINTNFRNSNGALYSGDEMYARVLNSSPVDFPAFYEPDEMYQDTKHILFGGNPNGSFINPYADMVRGYKQGNQTNIVAQIELSQKLDFVVEGLSARFLGSTTRDSEYAISRAYEPYYYTMTDYDPTTGYYKLLNFREGNESLNFVGDDGAKIIESTIYGELAVNYDRTFNEKHDVSGMLVGTLREIVTSDHEGDLQRSLPTRNIGISGRFTYGYDRRYFLEANFGYNGAERFAQEHRWGLFPSAGFGWFISNEDFWVENKTINKLKFKASYGMVGNDAIGDKYDRFFYLSRVSKDKPLDNDFGETDNNPNSNATGINISRYANPNITWEKSTKFNVGLETQLFSCIDFHIDYFREHRTDILINRLGIPSTTGLTDIPPASGSAPADVRANIGAAKSSGVEFTLDYSHSFSSDVWLRINSTFTYAQSEYTEYEEIVPEGMDWLKNVGQPIGQHRGLIAERLFIDEADIANSPVQTFDNVNNIPVMPGDIKYKDINEDGVINSYDMVPIGYGSVPKIESGVGVSFGVKGFDISCFFQMAGQVSFMIDPRATAPFVDGHSLLDVYADNRWTETNRNPYALYPRLSDTYRPNNEQASTWWLRDGSYLRLKSVELGYTLPYKLTQKAKIENLRIYLSGMNLFTLSKFDLWDVAMGSNGFNYPIQRVINIGLNIGF